MSFYVNNIEVTNPYFKGRPVWSIYYNRTKVWERIVDYGDWPGWDNATWENIYTLCKAKQDGTIPIWPEDIVLGSRKSFYFKEKLGSSWSKDKVNTTLVGINEASNTLTFQTDVLDDGKVPKKNLENHITSFYEMCGDEIKPYMKKVDDWHFDKTTQTLKRKDAYVWIFSAYEIAGEPYKFEGANVGGGIKPYPYLLIPENRKRAYNGNGSVGADASWWLSTDYDYEYYYIRGGLYNHEIIRENEDLEVPGLTQSGFAPAFVIG